MNLEEQLDQMKKNQAALLDSVRKLSALIREVLHQKNAALKAALAELEDFERLRLEGESTRPIPGDLPVSNPLIDQVRAALAVN
jgi:ABC-type transporter Mla subunit MlaD